MDRKFYMCLLVFGLTFGLLPKSPLYAQENPELMVDMMRRIDAIEAENRELRGQVEELRHDVTGMTQRMDTLNADIDYRLTNPESGALSSSLPHGPGELGPLAKEATSSEPASASDEYERARALLERGDYEAAEHAFAAFVAAHPKDKNAGAAQYWLGVTFSVRGEHEKAVAAFAKGYKSYPKSSKAADNLLKLAKSLGALDRKGDACTTLDQLATEYPKTHVKDIASERKKFGCK